MKRGAILLLAVLALALFPTLGSTQGIATAGFSGIPLFNGLSSFGGIFGGPSSATCGEELFPKGITEFYIGYMDHRNGATIRLSTDSVPLLGAFDVTHHYPVRGVWLGLSETISLSKRIGLFGSGWLLLPSNQADTEIYNIGVAGRNWNTRNSWWYVDGLASFSPFSGFSLLAGVRYDKFTTEFRDPFAAFSVLSLPGDTADVITENWIPLVGGQVGYTCSQSRLLFRVVGFPTLLGSVKYRQTFGGANSLEASGNYKNGYYLELFTQYVRRFGPGEIGAFARWSGTRGEVDLDLDERTQIGLNQNETFNTSVDRFAWTVGGSVSLRFDLPFVKTPFM